MAIREIKIIPDKILRQKAKKIKTADIKSEKIKQLILDIQETMVKKDGIGLAAPQIGVSQRMICVNTKDGAIVLINPKVLCKSLKKETSQEGCLSVPEVFGNVSRPTKIRVYGLDKNGKKIMFGATGLFARVVLHEIDHLDGVLFIDKATEITEGKEKLEKMKRKI